MALAPLAAGVGVGGIGFLIVVLLLVAVIVICLAMTSSLRRLRRTVAKGDFGPPDSSADATASGARKRDDPVNRDPGDPGGASV